MKKEIEIYSDETPLAGDNKPPLPEMIDDLIKLLATISHRFGNTRISFRLKWGAVALNDSEIAPKNNPMNLSKASDELAEFIIENQNDYIESLGYSIMLFHESLANGDSPAMALAFAKQAVKKQD